MQPLRTPRIMFRFILKIAAVLLTVCCCQSAFAAADLIITGKASDAAGKPLADATVMVYHAGPTIGYSLFGALWDATLPTARSFVGDSFRIASRSAEPK